MVNDTEAESVCGYSSFVSYATHRRVGSTAEVAGGVLDFVVDYRCGRGDFGFELSSATVAYSIDWGGKFFHDCLRLRFPFSYPDKSPFFGQNV